MATDLLGAWYRAVLGDTTKQFPNDPGCLSNVLIDDEGSGRPPIGGDRLERLQSALSVGENTSRSVVSQEIGLDQRVDERDGNSTASDSHGSCTTHDVSSIKNETS
jgi:hypothetical protein